MTLNLLKAKPFTVKFDESCQIHLIIILIDLMKYIINIVVHSKNLIGCLHKWTPQSDKKIFRMTLLFNTLGRTKKYTKGGGGVVNLNFRVF